MALPRHTPTKPTAVQQSPTPHASKPRGKDVAVARSRRRNAAAPTPASSLSNTRRASPTTEEMSDHDSKASDSEVSDAPGISDAAIPLSPVDHMALLGPVVQVLPVVPVIPAAPVVAVETNVVPTVPDTPPPSYSAVIGPPETPRTPRHPRPAPLAFNRTLSMDPGVHGPRRASASALSVSSVRQLPEESPPEFKQGLCSPSVCLKAAQFALALMCLGFVSDGYILVSHNITAMHFPFIVFSSYTIITGVILFSYVMGMKMRELLMRVFGTMGGLLFLISGICMTNIARVYWVDWEGTYEEGDTEEINFDPETIPRRQVCFAMQIALSFVASVAYFGDVIYSYSRTMTLLN